MTPALVVEAEAIGHEGSPPVLSGVRLRVAPGERVAILGANGAGKTTLLRAGVGLAGVRDGIVRVSGAAIRTPEEAVHAGAGLALQNPEDQLLGATVLEDAMIGPLHAGLEPDVAAARAREALAAVGLARFEDRVLERLSFGEKRRAALASVLAMAPSLLLLDEPTAGLDPVAELDFAALLAALARDQRAAVVVATHAIDLVPLLADRAVVLGEGRILADGPVGALFADAPLLARARLRAPLVAETWRALGRPTRDGRAPLTLPEVLAWNADRS